MRPPPCCTTHPYAAHAEAWLRALSAQRKGRERHALAHALRGHQSSFSCGTRIVNPWATAIALQTDEYTHRLGLRRPMSSGGPCGPFQGPGHRV